MNFGDAMKSILQSLSFGFIFTAFLTGSIFLLFPVDTAKAATPGCTDPLAQNFDPNATVNDGSCTYASATITFTERKQLPPEVDETSGLIVWQNLFWTHNDDTDLNIYGFTFENPETLETIELTGLTNIDWEELTQDAHYLYMGDFGNNLGNRTNLTIYKIEKQGLLRGDVNVEEIFYSYEDQTDFNPGGSLITDFDAEAFIVTDDFIYIFTKQWTSRETSVYRLPNEAGTHVAENIGTFNVGGLITGSVFLPEERLIALIGYNFPEIAAPFIWLLYDFQGDDFFSGNKRRLDFNFLAFVAHQLEAITTVDGLIYYATNEFASTTNPFPITIPQRIHKLDLTSFLEGYLNGLPSAESFFYRGAGSLSDLSNWATNPNGSGRIPTTFAQDEASWHIVSPDTLTLSTSLPVSGHNARIVLGDGTFPVHLILESELNAPLYMSENTSVHVEGVQPPAFGDVAANTSVSISNVADLNLSESTFWHLSISESSFAAASPVRSVAVQGDFSLESSSAASADGWRFVLSGSGDQQLTAVPSWTLSELALNKTGGTLTISAESQIRISDLLELTQGQLTGAAALTITSGGSVWDDAGLAPELKFERLISSPDFSGGNPGHWIALASPVQVPYAGPGGLLAPLWTQGFPGAGENLPGSDSSVLLYTAQNGQPLYTPPTENLISPGTGFFVFLLQNNPPNNNASPVDFTQPLDVTGQVPWFDGSNTYTFTGLNAPDTEATQGWNFLGNPVAAWLDWENPDGWQAQHISRFAWVWNPTLQQYRLMEQDGGIPVPGISTEPYLAPFQAFWVRSVEDNPELQFNRDAITRQQNPEQMFGTPDQESYLRFTVSTEGFEGHAALRFGDRFPLQAEGNPFDAPALWPTATNFSYVSVTPSDGLKRLMLMSRPAELHQPLEAELSTFAVIMSQASTSPRTLSWSWDDALPQNWELTLTYLPTGTVINLREQNEFVFQPAAGQADGQLNSQAEFLFTLDPLPTSADDAVQQTPAQVMLHPNYPNPFNPETRISYSLPESAEIRLTVYDSLGRQVAVLAEGTRSAGTHTVTFRSGNLSSGLYFYELRTPGSTLVRKMTVLK